MRNSLGWIFLAIGFLLVITILGLPQSMFGATDSGPEIRLDASKATPREVEDQTKQSVLRDYRKAWQSLEAALEEGVPDGLNNDFAGYALHHWSQTVKAQKAAGLSRRIVDHGHELRIVFYSPDGSAMQLRDTAQLEIQYRDGTKVLHTQNVTAHYLVLMTPAQNSWKVRVLQEMAPGSSQAEAVTATPAAGSK